MRTRSGCARDALRMRAATGAHRRVTRRARTLCPPWPAMPLAVPSHGFLAPRLNSLGCLRLPCPPLTQPKPPVRRLECGSPYLWNGALGATAEPSGCPRPAGAIEPVPSFAFPDQSSSARSAYHGCTTSFWRSGSFLTSNWHLISGICFAQTPTT